MKTNRPQDDEQFRAQLKTAVDRLEPADGCLEEMKTDIQKKMSMENTAVSRRFPLRRVILIAAAVFVTAALGVGLFALLRSDVPETPADPVLEPVSAESLPVSVPEESISEPAESGPAAESDYAAESRSSETSSPKGSAGSQTSEPGIPRPQPGTQSEDPSPAETYSEGLKYTLNKDEESYSVSGIGNCTDAVVLIPPRYDGFPVTGIRRDAFSECGSITKVVIPEGVTEIPPEAFYSCENLKEAVIPEGVKKIGDHAFYNCTKLSEIVLPDSLTTIEKAAFYHCDSLKAITIPSSVTTIEESAFGSCDSLETIEAGSGNKTFRSAGNCLIETAARTRARMQGERHPGRRQCEGNR